MLIPQYNQDQLSQMLGQFGGSSGSLSDLPQQQQSGLSGLGFNMGTAQLGMNALSGLGNIWGAFQANRLARDQFNFTRDVTNTNLNNQVQSYNTALSDRIRARTATEGGTQADVDAYLAQNRLTR